MHVDYLIIGQGITGTFLSYYLIKAGKKVLVIDDGKNDAPSRVASGIINPVTGRRVVETWMIETLLDHAQPAYEDIGEVLGKRLINDVPIINFHTTEQMLSAWNDRLNEGSDYITCVNNTTELERFFDTGVGAHGVSPTFLIDLAGLLSGWRQYLADNNCLLKEYFDIQSLVKNRDGVTYKELSAEKIFFCNGTTSFQYDYFKKLPFAFSKGEALIIEVDGLPQTNIYKQALSIVPYGDNKFWVGSSFEWNFKDDLPSTAFREKATSVLDSWLKLPYKVIEHRSSVRPASMERRPFVGLHPLHSTVGILNGMGTKGCSLAPYFANQLVEHILNCSSITPEADINRFRKILSA